MELIDTGVNKMTAFEDKLKKRIKEHDVAMTGLHNQGFVNGLKVALDLFDTTDELSVEKLQEQLNTAKKYIEHVIGTIKHDGHLETIQTDWILPYLEKALAAIGNEGSGDE